MDFLKALQVAAAQSSGTRGQHVPSEMPPLPQLPKIAISIPQLQQQKKLISSQANTLTFDKITKENVHEPMTR